MLSVSKFTLGLSPLSNAFTAFFSNLSSAIFSALFSASSSGEGLALAATQFSVMACSAGESIISSGGSAYICTTISGAGDGDTTYSAGNGISLAATEFSAGASTHIVVTAAGISVDDSPSFGGTVSAPNFVSTADTHRFNANNATAPSGTFLGVGDIYTLDGEPFVAVDGTVKSAMGYSGIPSFWGCAV